MKQHLQLGAHSKAHLPQISPHWNNHMKREISDMALCELKWPEKHYAHDFCSVSDLNRGFLPWEGGWAAAALPAQPSTAALARPNHFAPAEMQGQVGAHHPPRGYSCRDVNWRCLWRMVIQMCIYLNGIPALGQMLHWAKILKNKKQVKEVNPVLKSSSLNYSKQTPQAPCNLFLHFDFSKGSLLKMKLIKLYQKH